MIRTSVKPEEFTSQEAVKAYKDLSKVERVSEHQDRGPKGTADFFTGWTTEIRAHVFLCMLAYYVGGGICEVSSRRSI